MVVRIIADVAEGMNECLVHAAIEHERAASCMQSDLEDALFPLHPDVLVFVAIAFECLSFHGYLQLFSRQTSLLTREDHVGDPLMLQPESFPS